MFLNAQLRGNAIGGKEGSGELVLLLYHFLATSEHLSKHANIPATMLIAALTPELVCWKNSENSFF